MDEEKAYLDVFQGYYGLSRSFLFLRNLGKEFIVFLFFAWDEAVIQWGSTDTAIYGEPSHLPRVTLWNSRRAATVAGQSRCVCYHGFACGRHLFTQCPVPCGYSSGSTAFSSLVVNGVVTGGRRWLMDLGGETGLLLAFRRFDVEG
jgi:hypothetical protein